MDELEIVKQPEEIASVEAIVVENKEEEFEGKTKYCKHCGKKIPEDAIVCVKCGRQVEELKKTTETPNIVINNSPVNNNTTTATATATATNTNTNTNNNTVYAHTGKARKKWIAMLMLLFLGMLGGHKFYNGKYLVGIVYIILTVTWMLAWVVIIACIIDFFVLLSKPSVYYV